MKSSTLARLEIINDAHETELRVLRALYEYLQMGHRPGQALMNALDRVTPELYAIISGTLIDCFYKDSNIVLVLHELGYNVSSFQKIFEAVK